MADTPFIFEWTSNKLTISPIIRQVKMVTLIPDILHPSHSPWTLPGQRRHLIYLSIFGASFSPLNKILLLCKYIVGGRALNLSLYWCEAWKRKTKPCDSFSPLFFDEPNGPLQKGWRYVHWCTTLLPCVWNHSRSAWGLEWRGTSGSYQRGWEVVSHTLHVLFSPPILRNTFFSLACSLLHLLS